jgi:SAM-dependent methyltransferase
MNTEAPRSVEWADPDLDSVAMLIKRSREIGWRAALNSLKTTHAFFVKRMEDLALGNWHVLIGLPRESPAIDLGCGFGSLALGLGQYYRFVVGVDAVPNRLEFASLRARQDSRPANTFVRASGLELPFRASSFELVTLNGVLEWAGLYAKGDPRSLQIKMLGEVRRTLTSTGTIAVAIENRFAMETLVGMPDTHTGLRFAPALPRALANRLALAIRQQPFRTYLYDRRGYVKLAREAGFSQARVLDLVSSYNDYDYVIDTEDVASYQFLWNRGAVRSFYLRAGSARQVIARVRPSALGGFAYAYLLLAGQSSTTVLDSTHPFWIQAMLHGVDPGPARFACKGSDVGMMVVVTHDGLHPRWIIQIGIGLSENREYHPPHGQIFDALARRAQPGPAWDTAGIEVRTYRVSE